MIPQWIKNEIEKGTGSKVTKGRKERGGKY